MIDYTFEFTIGVVLLTICYISIFIGKYIETMNHRKKDELPWFLTTSTIAKIVSIIVMTSFIIGRVAVRSDDIFIRMVGDILTISCLCEIIFVLLLIIAMKVTNKNHRS